MGLRSPLASELIGLIPGVKPSYFDYSEQFISNPVSITNDQH